MLLFAAILGSFHHHHDLAEHPDCAVCAFVCQPNTLKPAGPALVAILPPILPVLFALLVLTLPAVRPTFPLRSRAPPQ
jgi:hypothetical protein